MNVFYEEEGALRVGAVLADNGTSLQIEAPHGKRTKIKLAAVLLRFEQPGIAEFMPQSQRAADDIELDFLWQCSSTEEFDAAALAREYHGRAPSAVEVAGVMLKLHAAPMYFYKRGRGRYKAAPEDALKAALAGVERRKQQAAAKDAYVSMLTAGTLPPQFEPLLGMLLYRPDKNAIEWKALDEASAASKATPAQVIERCGGIPSTHDYHLGRFLFEQFPHGTGFDPSLVCEPDGDLPLSDAIAFSIDDASTTEIDDAFSVTTLANGNVRMGIHIAAPALGMLPQTALDHAARERLSTVYYPAGKITMLPPSVIGRYTLAGGRDCPALSMYVELSGSGEVLSTSTRVERVHIAENLRHDTLEPLFNEKTLGAGEIEHPFGPELKRLWQWARALERARCGDVPESGGRPEYTFHVENDSIRITRRLRGTPIDKLVSELMIYVNSTWGRRLAESGTGAIYRVQAGGKVRMSTIPAAHAGLGVEHYVWASSPLRRYVDLLNQRQLIGLVRGESPPYAGNNEALLAIMREFESAYEVYGEFQRSMERYWCLRWLLQEDAQVVAATVLRENLCRLDDLPLVVRVPSLPALNPGAAVELEISSVDLLELTFHTEFRREVDRFAAQPDANASVRLATLTER